MGIFRKFRRTENHDGDVFQEPLPPIVQQMVSEAAVRYVALKERERRAYAAMHPNEIVPPLPDLLEIPMPRYGGVIDEGSDVYSEENVRSSSPFHAIASALGFRRSKSRNQYYRDSPAHFSRAGSPEHFRHRPPGSPEHFRRRAHSPYLGRSRSSSPYFIGEHERVPSPHRFSSPFGSSSANVEHRRQQNAQLSPNFEREQRFQQGNMMNGSLQYIPRYQQFQQPYYPINPVVNYQGYPMVQQQMYSPYYYSPC
ncbi:unnamed protein product [Rotaria socialis]|uniref:Uncharacterized protein n=1 Tax=Rotaria socialis TaxID=392032 RepID=A0A817X518_9BILA|nr:unnamed protein product [Rotaria socialis]CAF3363358.1 unnamed protein product [Rotaria socialis]CAF3416212.1 unnamed protein product [Rotaria socialis]CAF4329156.1 unnamed protein product [Rotaria socialis]CAF4406179.1 unnamed protein product [Rotaria socialis]